MSKSILVIEQPVSVIEVLGENTYISSLEEISQILLSTTGPQGIPGDIQLSDISYVHVQSVSATTWTIIHGLQFIPNITVVDSAGSVVEGDYSYPDENTVIATFIGGFTGKAYLS